MLKKNKNCTGKYLGCSAAAQHAFILVESGTTVGPVQEECRAANATFKAPL